MKRTASHGISSVFVFVLLGLFALFCTLTVLMGMKAYRAASERSGIHSRARIAASYVRTMLRGDDETGTVRAETAEGTVTEDGEERSVTVETLTLYNNYDGDEYVTRIYVWDGWLREWFTNLEEPFRPAEGERVCEAEALSAALEEGLLTVRLQSDGEETEVCLALRAAGGEVSA